MSRLELSKVKKNVMLWIGAKVKIKTIPYLILAGGQNFGTDLSGGQKYQTL